MNKKDKIILKEMYNYHVLVLNNIRLNIIAAMFYVCAIILIGLSFLTNHKLVFIILIFLAFIFLIVGVGGSIRSTLKKREEFTKQRKKVKKLLK